MTATQIEREILKQQHFRIKRVGPFLKNLISVTLVSAALLCLAYLLWGAFDWIISQGDKSKYEAARNKITHALIGLALVALVWLIWLFALYFLGIGEIINGNVQLQLGE